MPNATQITLVESRPIPKSDGRYAQRWRIDTDAGPMEHTSEAEWNDAEISNADARYTVAGVEMDANTIIALALHGYGPVDEGKSAPLDEGTVRNAREGGYMQ